MVNVQKSFTVENVSNCYSPDRRLRRNTSVSVARVSEIKETRCVKCVKCVVFMD